MKVGIVGLGHIGKEMYKLFPNAVVYDKYQEIGDKANVSSCEITFVCVPTPQSMDGSCDITEVEDVLSWLMSEIIVIRSTVPVGFCKHKSEELKKNILFQPEYYGETEAHPFADLNNRKWITIGGEEEYVDKVLNLYRTVYNSETRICITDSSTAEMAKYMTNTFLAMKVTFCNEFFDIATAMGINYNKLREVWLMDPRIGRSHTVIWNPRGYGGSCFPKDISAISTQAKEYGIDTTLLDAVILKNRIVRNEDD